MFYWLLTFARPRPARALTIVFFVLYKNVSGADVFINRFDARA